MLARWLTHLSNLDVDTEFGVTLSSAESEDHSMVRCASEAIGLANTIRELGHKAHVRIWSVARALRGGSGAIYIWTQQKIRGTVNPSDLTKHLDGQRLMMLCDLQNIKHIDGRPSSAPKLAHVHHEP